MAPYFLNVDLDVISKTKLDALARALGKRVIVLHNGMMRRQHVLVLESSRSHKGPDATIHALCSAAESLSPAARRLWTASRKDFNIGYELRFAERSLHFTLRPDTLHRVAMLRATLTVTCYRFNEAEPNTAPDRRLSRRRPTRAARKSRGR
jgi:hypothetical protein